MTFAKLRARKKENHSERSHSDKEIRNITH